MEIPLTSYERKLFIKFHKQFGAAVSERKTFAFSARKKSRKILRFFMPRATCFPLAVETWNDSILDVLRLCTKTKRVVSTEVMTATVVTLVSVFFFAYFSPNLGDKVLSLTDVDFDDKVFGSSTHFVMFYGPW